MPPPFASTDMKSVLIRDPCASANGMDRIKVGNIRVVEHREF